MHETEVSGEGRKGNDSRSFPTMIAVLPLTVWHPVIPLCLSSLSVSRDVVPTMSVLTLVTRRPEGIQRARFLATPLPHRRSLACSYWTTASPKRPNDRKHPTPPPKSMTSHAMTPQGQAKARTREHPHRKYRRAGRRWAGRRRRGRTGEAEGKKKEQKKKRKRKKKTRKTAKRSTRE